MREFLRSLALRLRQWVAGHQRRAANAFGFVALGMLILGAMIGFAALLACETEGGGALHDEDAWPPDAEDSRSATADAAEDASPRNHDIPPPARESCPEDSEITDWIELSNPLIENGEFPVPEGSPKNAYRVSAEGWTEDGDPASVSQFTWSSSDGSIVSATGLNARKDYVQVQTHADAFEAGTQDEPCAILSVWADNPCGPEECGQMCMAQVKVEFVVCAVVNMEGNWILSGGSFAFPFEVKIWQDGRALFPAGAPDKASYEGIIIGLEINVVIGNYKYKGTLITRDHIEGTTTRVGTDEFVAPWFGDRVGP